MPMIAVTSAKGVVVLKFKKLTLSSMLGKY